MFESLINSICSRRSGKPAGAPPLTGLKGGAGLDATASGSRAGVCAVDRQFDSSFSIVMWLVLALVQMCLVSSPAHAISHGDQIVNSAVLHVDGFRRASASVSVTAVVRTPSVIEFLDYVPESFSGTVSHENVAVTWYRSGSDPNAVFVRMPEPTPIGSNTPLDLSSPVPLVPASAFHEGDTLFVRVTDLDQNLDRTIRETILVTITNETTGETEVVRLTETGVNTGVFMGYISTTTMVSPSYNGIIPVKQDSSIRANYVDIVDSSDTSAAAVLVDPTGIVFDSKTGAPVDGAIVTLYDVLADRPATVYGDDGVSIFPATVTTGSTVSDNSGRLYDLPPGGFRFPFIGPGSYQLRVTPPNGYLVPSTETDAALRQLSGGHFTIATPGSRGETFIVNPGPVVRIDIPADPVIGQLWIQKTAGKAQVAAGDFLPYQLGVQNPSTIQDVTSVVVTDLLPQGFRYQKGSTRINGVVVPDPVITVDGRTLQFSMGDLAAKGSGTINYVVQVSAGARIGKAINQATAVGGYGAQVSAGTGVGMTSKQAMATNGTIISNTASAEVEVKSDFLSTRSILMGRVYNGACGAGEADPDKGVAGVRIFLEDGTFVDTDKNGLFHFEGVKPVTHVVQLDLDSLPPGYQVVACEENSRFAGRSYSQFVDMQGGTMWRVDFHVARTKLQGVAGEHDAMEQARRNEALRAQQRVEAEADQGVGEVSIDLMSSLKGKSIEYQVRLTGGREPLNNRTLLVTLPEGITYLANSSQLDGNLLPEPEVNGVTLAYPLGNSTGEWVKLLSFRALLESDAEGELLTKAVLTFDTLDGSSVPTPEAENILQKVREESRLDMPAIVMHPHFPTFGDELSDADRKDLDELATMLMLLNIDQITVTGHTDNVRIAPRSRGIHPDNRALSFARAKSVGRYLMQKLHLPPARLNLGGMGDSSPIATNSTREGRATNRRVEIRIKAARVIDKSRVALVKDHSGQQKVEIALTPVDTLQMPKGEELDPVAQEKKDAIYQNTVKENTGILAPSHGMIMAQRISSVRVCISAQLKPRLLLDGREISPERIGFTLKDEQSDKALYTYIGIDFGDKGEHQLKLQGVDPFGNVRYEKLVTIIRSGEIASIRLVNGEGNVADGKTPVKLRLEFHDASGNVVPGETDLLIRKGNLKPLKAGTALPETNVTAPVDTVRVDQEGYVLFQPVNASGSYRAELAYNSVTAEVETYVKPVMRDWILVGLAEGTAGYNTLSGHMENLRGADVDDKLYDNGRVAFYAKGAVKGEWLLTAAYDSGKTAPGKGNSLFQTIDPNTYYTLYGDASQQQYDAASARKLYLKIERDKFYALFGDFDTGMTVTELSRYSRRLNGIKSEFQGTNLEFTLFGTETGQSFVKDELPGDGTSGLYQLSRKNIVLNSEKITIEVRDRFRSELVVSTRSLSRFSEYSIDYESGTLFFKEPVFSRDARFNPVYIVAEYETLAGGKESLSYGGRAGVKLLDQKVKAGVSYIHEGQVSGKGDSYGFDTTIKLAEGTTFKGEAARTETTFGNTASGNAYLAELAHRTSSMDSRLYFRELEDGFGLGQVKGSEAGTRKGGIDTTYKFSDALLFTGQANRQYNLPTGAERDLVEGKMAYNSGNYGATLGMRHAEDRLGDGSRMASEQLTMGGSWLTLDRKLTLKADREQSLGGSSNADYPTRTLLGADYKVNDKAALYGQHEITSSSTSQANMTRLGVKSSPWDGGAASSSVERDATDNSERLFALFGLKQTVKLTDQWSVDGGLDRSQTLKRSYRFNTSVPPVTGGSDDFTALSLGSSYQEKQWNWHSRAEYRTSTSEDKWGFLTAFTGEPAEGWGWSARFQLFDVDSAMLSKISSDLRLGLVYRPLQTRWIILDRLDFLYGQQQGGTFSMDNRRVVNNLNANYRWSKQGQVSFQYGAKYVLETIDGRNYSGYTDLVGVEGRYDLTREWDLGLRGSLLHSWSSRQLDYSTGLSVGYNIVQNAWISLGYNLLGFTDKDFSAADFTAQGPYVRFRFKFDQNSVKDALKWVNG
jgi:uncharacterized repeat protein (TIGR01451 family)